MTEHTPKYLDLEAETEMLEALARDLAAMPARIKRAREIAQEADDKAKERWAVNRAELAGHKAGLDELSARQQEEHSARLQEITRREAALAERERALDAERQRIIERERWIEHRAADLSARLHGAAA
jgi:hypothetical protein